MFQSLLISFEGEANMIISIFTVEAMRVETVNPFMSLIVPCLKETAAHLLLQHKNGIFYEFACTYHAEGRFQ